MRCEMGCPMAMAAGNVARRRTDVGFDLVHAAGELGRWHQADIQLTDVHTFCVLIQFCAAAATAHIVTSGTSRTTPRLVAP